MTVVLKRISIIIQILKHKRKNYKDNKENLQNYFISQNKEERGIPLEIIFVYKWP